MSAYKNDLILRAAKGEKTERTPVWIMRQAGRILPEYREVRAQAGSFINLVKNPELVCEVTIQPVDILDVDAAIIFSDILVIPEAMGLPYQMVEAKGPYFENTISSESDLKKLHLAEYADYDYMPKSIEITTKALAGKVPLIGFAGAPFTIFCYMVEGNGSKTFSKAKKMLFTNNVLSHKLLEIITTSTVNYLKAQIKAGAAMLQLFDSWAGILSPASYTEFSLKYIEIICNEIKNEFPEIPITVFAKGAFFARKQMANLNCNTIGLDWNMDIVESRKIIGDAKTLQGNLDPCVLYGTDEFVVTQTESMLSSFGNSKHIANLGHGVYPDTDKEKVKLFVQTVKNYKHKN
jgi:uroporphyrinogen decarboxylase